MELDTFIREVEKSGRKIAVIPISRLADLERDMDDLQRGDFHTGFIDWRAGSKEKFYPEGLGFEAASIMMIASHSPVCMVGFSHEGKEFETILPPTYADNQSSDEESLKRVRELLEPEGFHAAPAFDLPTKLLMVHCGLGRYGRNNICYVDGFGSYAHLLALYSDLPSGEGEWHPVQRLDFCETCEACIGACPTQAIDADRLIIDAEKCVTAMNEDKKDFPDWLSPEAHTCLVGCMRCQNCCPGNRGQSDYVVKGCSFDEHETLEILNHKQGESYPKEIEEKLKSICMHYYGDMLPRNLRALLRTTG